MSPNNTDGFHGGPVPGVYVHPKEIGKLVKEFMVKHGNTVTIHDVRAELNAAGIVGYSQVSFDKWYHRLFVAPEFEADPTPAPTPSKPKPKPTAPEPESADKPTPEAVMMVYEATVHLLLAFLWRKLHDPWERDIIRRQVAAAREAHVAYTGEDGMLFDAALEKLCPKSS